MPVGVIGLGSHVPDRVISSADISRWTGASEDWVRERTGVLQRRYAEPGTTTSDLAVPAARQVLDANPDAAGRLTAIIVATCTPDVPQPATAAILQHKLGLRSVPAFDVNAVCSGFLYAMTVGESMVSGRFGDGYVLVVGADMFSTIMDRADRRTVSLFGDGAGAVLLGQVPDGYGVLASRLLTDGEYHPYVEVPAGGTRIPLDERARRAGEHLFRMDGRAVKDYALTTLRKVIEQALGDCGLDLDDIDRGASVVCAARNPYDIKELVDEHPGRVVYQRTDVSDAESVRELVDAAARTFGGIDVLVCNAGVSRDGLIRKLPVADWNETVSTNLTGVFLCTQAVVEPMAARGGGRIINVTSCTSSRVAVGAAAYSASKAAVEMFSRSAAVELAPKGIVVNCLAPGYVDEGMGRAVAANEKVWATYRPRLLAGRLARPEEIAAAALFLATEDSSYVNGHVLEVNGGLMWD
ncbi:SDR family oxidoreductase [Gandjariella thermophila]|uniref:Ketoreductase domain-containing protein n=1 Tax=Gandjariella thermophila TaxID=1931992 RepID=A0A4D4JGX5_9PSEU|nr:SDR family oxidoreductase [Gandjariella thermophila]GDY33153.1 hypothetical protein GTS_47860 [Gandjariella thermophila]